jgi:hypothetical protein
MLFTVPLAWTRVPPCFSVFLALTSPCSPSRVHAPPCSPQLASRVTTVCIESPGDQSISCHEPLRIADNISPTNHNHQKTRDHSSSPGLSSRVKPCAQRRTALRLRSLTPAAIPVFRLPCLRRFRSILLALASLDRACQDHCLDVSATLTTFDRSSSRWLGISDLIAEPEGPSSISRAVSRSRVDRLRS